jgi:catechol 2,3-dioxygenase-like lactoylglutathione lyase family enzyme
VGAAANPRTYRQEVEVLATKDSYATIAVKNLKRAREFYEGKLGLSVTYEDSEAVGYTTGNTSLLLYESEYAGSNQATAVTWTVGDQLEATMDDLRAKGVSFEHYELPGVTREGDLHVMGDMNGAWFKDPDGNIHGLVSGMPA